MFATWLFEHDYDIRLLLGDDDTFVIDDFRSALEGAAWRAMTSERIVEPPIDFGSGRACRDSPRPTSSSRPAFTTCCLSLLLNKPVIAISFHHKCSSLMRQMELSEYCHDIHQMDADRLIAQFREAGAATEERSSARSRQASSEARAALDAAVRSPVRRPSTAHLAKTNLATRSECGGGPRRRSSA